MRKDPAYRWFCVVYQKPVDRPVVPGEPCPLCHFPASSCGWRPVGTGPPESSRP